MADDNKLFSFQGYVYLGGISGRKIVDPVWVGDATMTVALETESVEHNESFSGQRLPYGRLTTKKSATATLTLFEARAENLALALYGVNVPVTSASVTAEAIPDTTGLVALDHALIDNLVLTDSTSGTPVVLTEGTNYTIENAAGGLIRILETASLTLPIKAAYDYGAANTTGMFTTTPPERFLKMVGVNTLNNAPVVVDLYRVRFDPASELALHNEEFGSFELSGSLLAEAGLMTGELGGFGTLTLGAAA
ncbi:MAG: hypothetical protein LBD68_09820 [Zoogloeaceae bacterium]|jgi:hypothetical protein|nr:hypothetical protein [Zoogloeaceae bacterium]